MQTIRPAHVLAALFWGLFTYFSVRILNDQLELTPGKGWILLAFFVVAALSSLSASARARRP